MISYIKGILEDMSPGMVVVDNHGIGYQMMVPMRGESFPKIGQEIKIYTHMHVREDDVSLFGFLSKEEKEAIQKQLESIYPDEKVVLSEETDASLLGGYVVRVGYEEYDHSYEGKLRRLERKLTGR